MIAVINWILASLATEYVVNAINKMLKINYKLGITVLHFGIVQIILMFVLSLSVAWLASFIPVNNVSRKKPIEAIRKN